MQAQPTPAAKSGIAVAHGYGLKIHVHHRHLIVEDGIGRDRRTRRYHRATGKLNRLVLIGRSGYITLDALRWLHDTGAALVHLDTNGELIAASVANGPDLAALRRAQALAATGPAGVEIARGILTTKIEGQRALLDELPGGRESTRTGRVCAARDRARRRPARPARRRGTGRGRLLAGVVTAPDPVPARRGAQAARALAHVRAASIAHHRRPAPGDQPGRRDPQLPVRAARSRDDLRLPRARARPRPRDLPHRPA